MRKQPLIFQIVSRGVLLVPLIALSGLLLSCTATSTVEVPREHSRSETRDRAHSAPAAIDIDKAIFQFDSSDVRLNGQTTEILRSPTGSFVNLLGGFGFRKQFQYSVEVVDFEIRPTGNGRSLVWMNRLDMGFRRVERRSDSFDEAGRESISALGASAQDLITPVKANKTGFLLLSEEASFVSDDQLRPVPLPEHDALFRAEKDAGVSFNVLHLVTDPRARNSFARFVSENPKVERKSWDGQPGRCVSGWSSSIDRGGVFRVYCFSEAGRELIGTEEFVYDDQEIVHYSRQSLRYGN